MVEVPHEDRVRCGAPGCGHSVYKHVHILRIAGVLHVYGSTCFAREFGNQPLRSAKPHLTGSISRVLSPEERALLVANTELLIAQFEAEQLAVIEQQRKDAEAAAAMRLNVSANTKFAHFTSIPSAQPEHLQFSPDERAAVEPEALCILNATYSGVDFYSPGFNGLLQSEIDRILRERTV